MGCDWSCRAVGRPVALCSEAACGGGRAFGEFLQMARGVTVSEGTNRGRSSSVRLGEWSARTLMKFMPSGMNAEFLICATFSFGSCGGEGSRSVLVQNRRSTQTTAGTRDEENASAAGAGTHHHLSRHRPRSLRSRREHTERAANARVARRGLPEPKRRPVRVRPLAGSREHPNTVV